MGGGGGGAHMSSTLIRIHIIKVNITGFLFTKLLFQK